MNVLVVGLGQQGVYYLNALTKLGIPQDDIVVHDIDPAKRVSAKQKFPGVQVTDEITFIGERDFDTVQTIDPDACPIAIVATNTPSHHKVLIQLIRGGMRYFLCEKPLAVNSVAVQELEQTVGAENCINIFTAYLMNFSPVLLWLIAKMRDEELIMTEGSVVWGKNRMGDTRPTPGDLEDELCHGVGILGLLASVNQQINSVAVSSILTYPPFADTKAQQKAYELDTSFPQKPNATSMVLARVRTSRTVVSWAMHSSFLYPFQTRRVSMVLVKWNSLQPVYSGQMDFYVKTGGVVEDQIALTKLADNQPERHSFPCDKILDQTRAFLAACQGKADPRLTGFATASKAVVFSEAVLRSSQKNGELVFIN